MDFLQCAADVVDAAEGEGADDTIERPMVEWKLLATEYSDFDVESRLLDPFLGPAVHTGVRIDGRDFVDGIGVMRQVQPRAEADFQDLAPGSGKQIPAMRLH